MNATSLSVPDALKPPDRQDEYTRASCPLLGRTRDPELRSFSYRAQRLRLPGSSASSCSHRRHDVDDEIVLDPNHDRSQACATNDGVALDLGG